MSDIIPITEVQVKRANPEDSPVLAYAKIVFADALVIGEMKLIGISGRQPFLTMPTRDICDRCPACNGKVPLLHKFCFRCGSPLVPDRCTVTDDLGRPIVRRDICHPVTAELRDAMTGAVVRMYEGMTHGG